jgi:hypothetical protein
MKKWATTTISILCDDITLTLLAGLQKYEVA